MMNTSSPLRHSLFRRTFAAFLVSFSVLILILIASLAFGYQRSLQGWSEQRSRMIHTGAQRLLLEHYGIIPSQQTEFHRGWRTPLDPGPTPRPGYWQMENQAESRIARRGPSPFLPPDIPVRVFDRDGNQIATNRAADYFFRSQAPETMHKHPVYWEEQLLGYYNMGPAHFRNDAANQNLWKSILLTAVAGAFAAFAAAAISAWIFARNLSAPAAAVAEGIDKIAHGKPAPPIPERGAAEITRIAQAANLLAKRLEREQQLRSQWARDAVHDLRTPVASVKAQLEAIEDGIYSADTSRIDKLLSEMNRIELLINQLDELMRLEESGQSLHKAPVSAAAVFSPLLQSFQHTLQKKSISLILSFDEDAMLCIDQRLFHRAIENVFKNAIRHTPMHGTIECSVKGSVCSISNEGTPIPPNELPFVFDRLFRGEFARSSQGSGLGLSITRRIVQLHGGRVHIHSDQLSGPGKTTGTSVHITLPSC